ncbi:MAG: hypothetical protein QOK43_298 [Acidimicrobiaceae bacterium]|jgi:hypothetical protein|nr:hypothetical protein [Acidimicrobiaceae bacterium]MDQ1444525.1 hypothetical protein [Acidimicrobiaceae bacterium]
MPLLPKRPRPRLSAALVVMALSSSACGMPGFLKVADPADGTTVKKLSTDLAFGVEAPAAPAAPFTLPVASVPNLLDLTGLSFDIEPPQFEEFKPFTGFSGNGSGDCPQADENTFPEKSATFEVIGTVESGTYKWKQKGTFDLPPLLQIPLPPLTRRIVRALPNLVPGINAFEIEQPVGLFGSEIDTYEVRRTSQFSPADGIFLTRLQYKMPDFNIDFNPVPALAPQLVKLPAQNQPAVSATSVDPASGLVLNITGSVDAATRYRLDACGEVVEAWKFTNGVRVLQGLPPNQANAITNTTYEFYFAPQLGGLIVGDHIVTQGSFGPLRYSTDSTSNIGGLKPLGPAPA